MSFLPHHHCSHKPPYKQLLVGVGAWVPCRSLVVVLPPPSHCLCPSHFSHRSSTCTPHSPHKQLLVAVVQGAALAAVVGMVVVMVVVPLSPHLLIILSLLPSLPLIPVLSLAPCILPVSSCSQRQWGVLVVWHGAVPSPHHVVVVPFPVLIVVVPLPRHCLILLPPCLPCRLPSPGCSCTRTPYSPREQLLTAVMGGASCRWHHGSVSVHVVVPPPFEAVWCHCHLPPTPRPCCVDSPPPHLVFFPSPSSSCVPPSLLLKLSFHP